MDLAAWQLDPGPAPSPHVGYGRRGRVGLVVLDRPKAINSLTLDMVTSLHAQLHRWADDDEVGAVVLHGNGDRGLCSGADVIAVRAAVLADGEQEAAALRFFGVEYEVDHLLATYPKPYVALMAGVTMGGGLGLSGFAATRLADPAARIAMPEVTIGFFPDVGARYLLNRCPGEVGAHLAMTGLPVGGADAVRLGFADAVLDPSRYPYVIDRYAAGDVPSAAELGDAAPTGGDLDHDHAWIDECYAGDDAAVILDRLEAHPDGRAAVAAAAIRSRSPFAVAFALASLRDAAGRDLAAVLASDGAIAPRMVRHPDFAEGVRAQLVDKDRTPRWAQPDLRSVDPALVEEILHGPGGPAAPPALPGMTPATADA